MPIVYRGHYTPKHVCRPPSVGAPDDIPVGSVWVCEHDLKVYRLLEINEESSGRPLHTWYRVWWGAWRWRKEAVRLLEREVPFYPPTSGTVN